MKRYTAWHIGDGLDKTVTLKEDSLGRYVTYKDAVKDKADAVAEVQRRLDRAVWALRRIGGEEPLPGAFPNYDAAIARNALRAIATSQEHLPNYNAVNHEEKTK